MPGHYVGPNVNHNNLIFSITYIAILDCRYGNVPLGTWTVLIDSGIKLDHLIERRKILQEKLERLWGSAGPLRDLARFVAYWVNSYREDQPVSKLNLIHVGPTFHLLTGPVQVTGCPQSANFPFRTRENRCREICNSKPREEYLNREISYSMKKLCVAERGRIDFVIARPNSSPGYTPASPAARQTEAWQRRETRGARNVFSLSMPPATETRRIF